MSAPRPLSLVSPLVVSPFPAGHGSDDRIAILLTTYNGERFLREQLDSIARQSHPNWAVYASDDGSTDQTLEILHHYQQCWGEQRLTILQGPRQGFAENFMSLIRNLSIKASYFAFSDQDDVWFPDKLERSLRALRCFPPDVPALFCSRTHLVDVAGKAIGYSPLFRKRPSFRNALVQSLAGANTMLLNGRAKTLMSKVPADACVVSHDWLAYLLTTGCDGHVLYDAEPTLDYRQHGGNLVGANSSMRDRFIRLGRMWRGTFRDWNQHNLMALRACSPLLSDANRLALERFERARDSGLLRRLFFLKKAGVYRQTKLGSIGLVLAASLGRV